MDVRRLREQTRKEHEATEALVPLMGPGLQLETYQGVLCAMLPIVEGWELWAAEHAPDGVRPMLAARRRSHFLRLDLMTFGISVPASKVADSPVDWTSVVNGAPGRSDVLSSEEFEAGFMGAFYVMEGSSLGGRFIAKHVEVALALEPGRGNAYFRGHGEATGALWRETLAAIAAVPETQSGRVIAAAKRAFVAFGEVMRTAPAECAAG